MKKRLLALALAAVMVGSVGLTACDLEEDPTIHHDGDPKVEDLIEELADFRPSYVAAKGTVDTEIKTTLDSVGEEGAEQNEHISYKGEALTDGTNCDAYLTTTSKYDEVGFPDVGGSILLPSGHSFTGLAFFRGEKAYFGDLDDEYTFDEALAEFTKEDSENSFEFQEDYMDYQGSEEPPLHVLVCLLQDPSASKLIFRLCKNISALFGGEVKKEDGGYALTYDLIASARSLIDRAILIVQGLKEDATLSDLFAQAAAKDICAALLKDLTAKDAREQVLHILDLVVISEEVKQIFRTQLPAAGEDQSAARWLLEVIDAQITAEGETHSFGEFPLFQDMTLDHRDTLFGMTQKNVMKKLQDLRKNLEGYLAEALFGKADPEESTCDLVITFHFDQSWKPVSLTAELAADTVYQWYSDKETVYHCEGKATITFPEKATFKSLAGAKYRTGRYVLREGTETEKENGVVSYFAEDGEELQKVFDITVTGTVKDGKLTFVVTRDGEGAYRKEVLLSELGEYTFDIFSETIEENGKTYWLPKVGHYDYVGRVLISYREEWNDPSLNPINVYWEIILPSRYYPNRVTGSWQFGQYETQPIEA